MKRLVVFFVLWVCVCVCFVMSEDGIFVDSGQNLGTSKSQELALGDLNGDGEIDAIVVNCETPNMIWVNHLGIFSDSGEDIGTDNRSVDIGDVDSDGDLDAIIAAGGGIKIYKNNGTGNFTIFQNIDDSHSDDVALGDLDGDGNIDMYVLGYWGSADKVYFNDGTGYFTNSGQSLGDDWGVEAKLGDLDKDGDLDAFVANYLGGSRVWFNNGHGFFESGPSISNVEAHDMALGDLDRDGDLDAYITIFWHSSNYASRVFFNDGSGNFTGSGQLIGTQRCKGVALGDLDGDGDLDAFQSNAKRYEHEDQSNKVWLNDGNGFFTDSGQRLGDSNSHGIALGDLDKDGDLDAFVSNTSNQPNRVWLNQTITNQPPVAVCKNIEISANENCQAFLTPEDVDNGSYDPDEGDEITLSIDNEGPLSLGVHYVTLTVTDSNDESDTCVSSVTVIDNTSPVPNTPMLPTVTGECSASVTETPKATDNCAGEITGTTNDPLTYTDQGTYVITWHYEDGNGNIATQPQTIVVNDTTCPVISSLTASPDVLRPPNHKMIQVAINAVVSDNCDANSVTKIISVTSNEPVNGTGDGDTTPDWEITGDMTLNLRAERSGNGIGRIYTITVESKDASGNISTKDVTVTVPKNKREK